MAVHKRCGSGYFNPRSREGSDRRDQKWWNYVIISIRAPAKGATSVSSFFPDTSGFQSALPRRERHKRTDTHWIVFIFQSALPRRERPENIIISILVSGISIRAPAKGATTSFVAFGMALAISIRAPAKGATAFIRGFFGVVRDFNPRSREGSDAIGSDGKVSAIVFQSALPRRERHRL